MKLTVVGKLVVLVVVLTIGVVVGAAGAAATKPDAERWRCVVVRPGDTLWEIARAVDPARDPRAVVDSIGRRNAVRGAVLIPGRALWVPVGESGSLPRGSECGVIG